MYSFTSIYYCSYFLGALFSFLVENPTATLYLSRIGESKNMQGSDINITGLDLITDLRDETMIQ